MSSMHRAVWHPKNVASTNLGRFMSEVGVEDFRTLRARSIAEPEWFWDALVRFLSLVWVEPYRKVLDESPHLCGLLDPLQGLPGLAQPQPQLPQLQDDAPRGSTQAGALSLTARQCDILSLIAAGRSNKEIARITGITPETVKTHVKNIFVKLAVEKRAQAVARAHTLGLVGAPVHAGTPVF